MSVLVLSNAADETANYLCGRMREVCIDHHRINTEEVPSTCELRASPNVIELRLGDKRLRVGEIHAVWYRRPKRVELSGQCADAEKRFAEAEWTAAVEGFLAHIHPEMWINHPSRIMAASAKLEQLTRADRHGLNVPPWLCTSSRAEARGFFRDQAGQVVAKPLYSGYIERESPKNDTVIYTSRVGIDVLSLGAEDLGAPTLFQREIVGGVDVRVTIVDETVSATSLTRADKQTDIRRNNMADVDYGVACLPDGLCQALLGLVRSYGLRFAAVDLMVVGNEWYFLEINPNGQWAWLDIVGGSAIYANFLQVFRGTA